MLFYSKKLYLCSGEMAEWSIAAVLKTVVQQCTGGSNPSFSAEIKRLQQSLLFFKILFVLTGGMPEWSNGAVSKTVDRISGPRVRIPLPPQKKTKAMPSCD